MTWRIFHVAIPVLLLAACGGGGSGPGTLPDDGGNGPDNPSPVSGDCDGSGSGTVTISGVAEYEFVPAAATMTGVRLDYGASEFRPIRKAEVHAICPGSTDVHDAGFTDENGAFILTVPANADVAIRVRAALDANGDGATEAGVVDNTSGQALWAVQGDSINSGSEDIQVQLRASSGWDGSSYSSTRAAAPFAILDSVYTAMQKVLAADPAARFPELKLNWSADNRASCSGNTFPFADGCIGTSFYVNYGGSAGRNIFILGDADNDTDEYDNHVIIHEWGHYYEDTFARSDSIGGAHGGGDALDPRVAFGEGWGNAFSGIVTDDPVYVDTRDDGFSIDVEEGPEGAMGWWNEASVQEIIYDLYDGANDDAASLGFGAIHAVLTGGQRTTQAMTTLFSFIHFLKQRPGVTVADVRSVVASHDIAVISDEWGDGRDNGALLGSNGDDGAEFGAGFETYVSPVYTDLATTPVTAGEIHGICTSNAVDTASASEYNRLGARRFLRFSVDTAGQWRISVDSDSAEADRDPDFFVWLAGSEQTRSGGSSNVSGTDFSSATPNPDGEGNTEVAEVALSLDTVYVLEVMDWLNVDDNPATGGDICLDITFEKI
ncbi:MAG TPA: hypothetical protein VF254_03185 [Gammaproteobacteria bacterium]